MRFPRFSAIEPLEARIAPATLIWDGSVGNSDWFDPQNWDQNIVPGPSDTAILSIDSQIALSASTSVAEFRQSNGRFSSPAGVTFTATSFVWTGGSQEGAGTTVADATLEISGDEDKHLLPDSGAGRTLISNGVGNFSGSFGSLSLGGSFLTDTEPGSHFINNGTFNALEEANFSATTFGGGATNPPIITNSAGATFNKSGEGTGVTVPFINAGTINVDSGFLLLGGGGSNTGLISVDVGASLEFGLSGFTFETGGTLNGSGDLSLRDALVSVFGAFELTGIVSVMGGGTLDFNTLSPTLRTLIQQDAGSTVTGSGNITITEFFTWSGGTQAGSGTTTYLGSGGSIGGDAAKVLNQRTLNNNGTFTWSEGSGNVTMSNGAVFNNSGSFSILSDASWIDTQTGAESVFRNLVGGTMSHLTGQPASTRTFDVRFENAGDLVADNLRFIKSFSQSDGETFLDGGRVDGGIAFNFTGGELGGIGTLIGDVLSIGATVQPGGIGVAGTLSISGSYTQRPEATLVIELGGTTAGTQYDQFVVGNVATLGGVLEVKSIGGFLIPDGGTFDVIAYATSNGAFASLDAPSGVTAIPGPTVLTLNAQAPPPGPRSLTITDADGDVVTVKVNKGSLPMNATTLGPNGEIQRIDLRTIGSTLAGATLTIQAQQTGNGDGVVNVGAIDATGMNLARISLDGDLGQIDIGSNDARTPALKSLVVGSLGAMGASTQAAGTENPLLSEVNGSLGKLTVGLDVRNAVVEVSGKLGKVLIGGSLIDSGTPSPLAQRPGSIGVFLNGGIPPANASHAGTIFAPNIGSVTVMGDVNGGEISAETQIKNVKIVGQLTSDDPLDPAILRVGAGISKVVINGNVNNALILAGYNRALEPRNPDASIGKVTVKGDWTASSVVAGIADPTDNGYGINDTIIPGDATPDALSRIAGVIIKGTATGSATLTDRSAITAQNIGALRIDGEKVPLTRGVDDLDLDPIGQNFRAVEI